MKNHKCNLTSKTLVIFITNFEIIRVVFFLQKSGKYIVLNSIFHYFFIFFFFEGFFLFLC